MNTSASNSPITQRADKAEILYNTLAKVLPDDIDGFQQAYVDFTDNDTAEIYPVTDSEVSKFYGMEPVTVAKMGNPFALIPQYEPEREYGTEKAHNKSILRQALRRIVESV